MPKAYRLALAAFLLLSLLTLLPHATASAQAPSGPPAIWGGLAWIDGELAPPGTAIKAMQGTTVLGQGVVEADGRFKPFQIKQPTSGRSIIFLVGNALVPEPTRWVSGSLRIDLELRARAGAVASAQPAATATPGFQGTRSERGPQGERGPAGRDGAQGERGPAGRDGAQGERGSAGPIGSPGAEGSRGKLGPRGEEGPRGRAAESSGYDLYTLSAAGVAVLLALAALVVGIMAMARRGAAPPSGRPSDRPAENAANAAQSE